MADRVIRSTRLSPPWRKTVMVLHMVCGIGWMGLDIARCPVAS